MNLILVVPDGILNHKKNNPTISNTYKAALDLAINEASNSSRKIVLLPANSFGTSKNEQDYAEEYLIKRNFNQNSILKGITNSKRYISTRQNFKQVIRYGLTNCSNGKLVKINRQLVEGLYTLISSHLHIDRTLLIIKYFNWAKPKKILVSYSKESPQITKRLFYYRSPVYRMFYEIIIICTIKVEFKIKFIIQTYKKFLKL